jgi:hypothetical protein
MYFLIDEHVVRVVFLLVFNRLHSWLFNLTETLLEVFWMTFYFSFSDMHIIYLIILFSYE